MKVRSGDFEVQKIIREVQNNARDFDDVTLA